MSNEERLKILQMLDEGKISAEEAATLLRAMDGGRRSPTPPPPSPGERNRFLHVKVTNLNTEQAKVNVTIPIGLVGVGLRMAARFAPEETQDVDFEGLEEMIASGVTGKLVEVVDSEDNERVEIFVE